MNTMKSFTYSAATLTLATLLISLTPALAGPLEKEIIQPPAPVSPWQFRLEAYGWLTSLEGTSGVGSFQTNIDAPFFNEILDHLDFAAAMQLEVRKGRWGVMADGFYAKLGAAGDTPGPLYASATADLQQVLAEVVVTYRVFESRAGFVDVYAGGRYNYLGLEITGNISKAGVQRVSEEVSARVVTGVANRAVLAAALRDQAPDSIGFGAVNRIARAVDRQRLDLVTAVAVLRNAPPEKVAAAQLAVNRAEKRLANAINRELSAALPSSESADKQWIDPLIGVRGQWNITERFFAAAQADIGGFGAASRLAWMAQATLGYNFTKNVFAEAGYRYLYTDYTDGGFLYDVSQFGAFVGLGLKF